MKCLVTGGTGFIGSNIALHLQDEGHQVIITGNESEQYLSTFKGKHLHPSFIGIDWDAIGKVDVLFHQAALNDTRNLDRNEMLRANVESAKKLFQYVIDQGCKRIVFASSTAVYGRHPAPYKENATPFDLNTPYAESKKLVEDYAAKLAKEHPEVKLIGLRYCNVYGPRENHKGKRATMIYQFAQQMLQGNPRMFEFGEQRRDYVYVKDVVSANMLAARAKESCVVNCGSGMPTTFNDIVKHLNAVLNLNRKPEYMQNPFKGNYQDHTECDMSCARDLIGFVPKFDILAGIKDYYKSGFLVPLKQ